MFITAVETNEKRLAAKDKKGVATKDKKSLAANSIKVVLPEAELLREQLVTAKKCGQRCRKQAMWVGVERYVFGLYFSFRCLPAA
jgi:hypothetical protein